MRGPDSLRPRDPWSWPPHRARTGAPAVGQDRGPALGSFLSQGRDAKTVTERRSPDPSVVIRAHKSKPPSTEATAHRGTSLGGILLTVRAGDGARTHDILLGKQTLCQLSYTRPMSLTVYMASQRCQVAGRTQRQSIHTNSSHWDARDWARPIHGLGVRPFIAWLSRSRSCPHASTENSRAAHGRHEPAVRCARQWLPLDRVNEAAHGQLMRLPVWFGRRHVALRQAS